MISKPDRKARARRNPSTMKRTISRVAASQENPVAPAVRTAK
jgi:hypothetical protein